MRFILITLIILNVLYAERINIDLKPIKNDYYSIKKDVGMVAYNSFDMKTFYLIINDLSTLNNPLYSTKEEKAFWLLTGGFIQVLKSYKFSNADDVYFVFYDGVKSEVNQGYALKVNLSHLNNYNNRDFSVNDEKLLKSNGHKRYKLLPIRELFLSAEIIHVSDGRTSKLPSITKKYHKFISEYTFDSLNDLEFKVENNQEQIDLLKKEIHYDCIAGRYDNVKLYVELGFNLDKKDSQNNQTLLQYAALNGHYKIVKLLVENGANPNSHNKGDENAYLAAERAGHIKIANYLKPMSKVKSRYVKTKGKRGLNYCYAIQNENLKNSCIAISKNDSSKCYAIQNNNDLLNSCLAITKNDDGRCFAINSETLKNNCRAITKNDSSQCYAINTSYQDTINGCVAMTKKDKSKCYAIQNQDKLNNCLSNF